MPLGVIPQNEQYTDQMVTILEKMYEYIPVRTEDSTHTLIPFGGDQLTIARAVTAKKTRVTSKGKKALRGLMPFCADWHAKMNFMQV